MAENEALERVGNGPYRPLNKDAREIRLLRLEPGTFEDDLHISLEVVSLDHRPNYEALSYVWGTIRSPRPILVNGHPMKITENLDCALRYLRYREAFPRVLWIDALCINQKNLEERSHQVNLMSGIYAGASDVLIWLSPHANQFNRLMRYLTYHVLPTSSQDHWELFKEIVRWSKLSWFSRVWVAQELVLSTNDPICCLGRRIFRWSTSVQHISELLQLIMKTAIPDQHTTAADAAHDLLAILTMFNLVELRNESARQSLWEVLQRTLRLEASDPRDKVYGVLGISKLAKPLNPDYTLSAKVVFARAVATMVQENEVRFYIDTPLQIREIETSEFSPDELSWVPDFAAWSRSLSDQQFPRPDYVIRSSLLQASWLELRKRMTADTCVARVCDDYRILCVTGRILGAVTWKARPVLTDVKETLCWIHEVYNDLLKVQSISSLGFFEVLEGIQERWKYYGGVPGLDDRFLTFGEFLAFPSPLDEETLNTYLPSLLKTAEYVNHGTFFLTDQGQLGRSYHPRTDGILPGDLLVGLFGIDMPFLLRPQDDGKHRMINVAFVVDHVWGAMPGYEEHLPKEDWSNLEELGLRTFEIV
jgi:hypothetical protein